MKLIDADILYRKLGWSARDCELAEIIEKIPTVDAVEVVRCKDCKWWSEVDDDCGVRYGQCINPKYVISDVVFLNEDWYCADGERKEE